MSELLSKEELEALAAFTDAAYRCSFRKVMPPEIAAIVDSLREAYDVLRALLPKEEGND